MKTIDDGGPAFSVGPIGDARGYTIHPGMSLRDWFAGQALAGLLANPGGPVQSNPMSGTGYCNGTVESTAEWAFHLADAMIAARKVNNEPK